MRPRRPRRRNLEQPFDRIGSERRVGVDRHRERRLDEVEREGLGAGLGPGVLRRPDHGRPGGCRNLGGLVGGAVVDDDDDRRDHRLCLERADRVDDGVRLVVRRNDDGQIRRSRFGAPVSFQPRRSCGDLSRPAHRSDASHASTFARPPMGPCPAPLGRRRNTPCRRDTTSPAVGDRICIPNQPPHQEKRRPNGRPSQVLCRRALRVAMTRTRHFSQSWPLAPAGHLIFIDSARMDDRSDRIGGSPIVPVYEYRTELLTSMVGREKLLAGRARRDPARPRPGRLGARDPDPRRRHPGRPERPSTCVQKGERLSSSTPTT